MSSTSEEMRQFHEEDGRSLVLPRASVLECGLWNLTQDALTLLVHIDKDRVEKRNLVRLEEPQDPQDDGRP